MSDHGHVSEDLIDVPTLKEFQELQLQVEALAAQCNRMAAVLLAEREVGAAIADGNDTIDRIATVLQHHSDVLLGVNLRDPLGLELAKLAAEIRKDPS